ncbi:UDP-glucose/GDP-mannose dehydrogenase family protein [Leucobacter sp. wl10]|uniref:UDP-glucose dehydrogenase family protein n=1 Tax=Leucobacter sp. wl10 TaxID=2304677 RepID=UPI000E5A16B6|nr:UDP-glucose/GDP-mannose dehydrogenase family protein [Leucobacter sp. wl10]RGE23193.1 UDP-glucose/GDP-mannose dehydrogenase family protein [Leucobacter sp. wl10]
MKLSVKGCGYLGAVHAAAMASLGHEVVGVDPDARKIAALAEGRPPFFEPELAELLRSSLESGRLTFTTDTAAVADATVHFIAVGTPQGADGLGADLRFVDAAIDDLLPFLEPGDLVVGKSTVPVGTAARLAERVRQTGAALAWNPEFLREGFAVRDTIAPDRIVYGLASDTGERDAEILDAVYAAALQRGTPRLTTDYATAELVKVAANSFLATKISFINAMAEIAEVVGANVVELADAIGYDERIGRKFLGAGLGFGGGCLPKDIRAFTARAEELGRGESVVFLRNVDEINLRRRSRAVEMVAEALGGEVRGRRVSILGLAFKPNSDDIRDSPALDVAVTLHDLGAEIVAYDPEAIANARVGHPQLRYADGVEQALQGAEAVVLATEWAEFKALDPEAAGSLVAQRSIIDGRNVLVPEDWRAAGWDIRSMGR